MTYVITEPCVDVKDKGCLDVCPVDCIYEGDRTLYIHPDECIDCHACEPVCPVGAIFPDNGIPSEFTHYLRVNAEFFSGTTQLGTPGGAGPLGPLGVDHEYVAALPTGSPNTVATDGRILCADSEVRGEPTLPTDVESRGRPLSR